MICYFAELGVPLLFLAPNKLITKNPLYQSFVDEQMVRAWKKEKETSFTFHLETTGGTQNKLVIMLDLVGDNETDDLVCEECFNAFSEKDDLTVGGLQAHLTKHDQFTCLVCRQLRKGGS